MGNSNFGRAYRSRWRRNWARASRATARPRKGFRGGEGFAGKLLGDFARFLHPYNGRVSRFLGFGILAGGFSELFAGLRDIEDVVDDLECESHVVTEAGEGFELGGGAIGAHAAQPHGTAEQGGGFPLMDIPEMLGGNGLAFGFEVGDLAGDELERAGGRRPIRG